LRDRGLSAPPINKVSEVVTYSVMGY